jgi:8-oxo-dGTP pyrophosphatase MutT (NUDIX family)
MREEKMLFEEIHYRNNRNLLDLDNGNIIFRRAVRAVIINKNKILMAHLEKTDEYKFPGGGREDYETVDEALKREVLEEVGYNVIKINEKIGTITEFAIAKEGGNNIFKMISEYYLVEVENIQLKQNLEEYEKELLFKPCWIEIINAYRKNYEKIFEKCSTTTGIQRETIALEKLCKEYKLL